MEGLETDSISDMGVSDVVNEERLDVEAELIFMNKASDFIIAFSIF